MADARIRYCTTEDGVRIAYAAHGEGTPLIMCPFFVESFTIAGDLPEYREFIEGLGRGRQLIQYDMRGTGLSQRDVSDFSLDALVRDVRGIVRALRIRRCVLYGAGLSGPRAVAYAVRYPRDVSHLVLYSTFVRPAEVMPVGEARGFIELARSNWGVAAQALVDLSGRERSGDLNVSSARIIRESATGDTASRLFEAGLATFDVSNMLADVRVPTIVIQPARTELFRSEFGRDIASAIPNAQLRLMEGNVNWLDAGAGTAVARITDEFLGVRPAAAARASPSGGAVRTVLFTDLVGHTEMMQRLGDDRGRAVLREHERLTRDVLKRHDGEEVKTMGDGFMASFSSVTNAIDCAIALQREMAATPLPSPLDGEGLAVRVGLNAGEPIEEEGDLFGATVIIASRVAALGGPGEILIPEPLRHLLAGKNYAYTDRGAVALKGFSAPVRLYEVRWRD